MQHRAARGVVDLSPNRAPAIRKLDLAESMEVLDVASAMTRLLVRGAAAAYRPEVAALLQSAMKDLAEAASASEPGHFGAARRRFYRSLLLIGGNRELRSEEHTSELQSLLRRSYAVCCLKKQNTTTSLPAHIADYQEFTYIIRVL